MEFNKRLKACTVGLRNKVFDSNESIPGKRPSLRLTVAHRSYVPAWIIAVVIPWLPNGDLNVVMAL